MNKKINFEHVAGAILILGFLIGVIYITSLALGKGITGEFTLIKDSFKKPKGISVNEEFSLGGDCVSNTDCIKLGCYDQFCLSKESVGEPNLECGVKEDFSVIQNFSCSCYKNSCAWIKEN